MVALVLGGMVWTYLAEREVVTEGVEVVNAGGRGGTALVVYHPGLSGYVPGVMGAFVDGLVAEGWRVERTTASARAPVDLTGYDLLVLGTPTYWWRPSWPVRRYVERVGEMGGTPVAMVVTASGQVERSRALLGDQVRKAGGELIVARPLTVSAPNAEGDPRPNEVVARDLARQAGERAGEVAAGGRGG